MKHISSYILLLFVIVFSFCKKEEEPIPPKPVDPPPPIIELGRIAYDRNGVRINYLGNAFKEDNYCGLYTKDRLIAGNALTEQLSIHQFPLKIGTYKLGTGLDVLNGNLFFNVLDEIRAIYESKGLPDDFIEIIEYDSEKQTIQGKFNVTVVNYYGNDVSLYGQQDTIRFTNGIFHIKVQ